MPLTILMMFRQNERLDDTCAEIERVMKNKRNSITTAAATW